MDPAAAIADSMKGYGTNSATLASGLDGVTAAAISVASCTASALVEGFSFQLPEMMGVRAMNSATSACDDRVGRTAGEKAAAEAKQAARASVVVFMV